MKVCNLTPGARLFILAKGDPKSGKTIFAGSFPNVYFLETDLRIAPLATYYPGREDIDYDDFTRFDKLKKKVEELRSYCPYSCVVLDSLTFACNLAVSYLLGFKGDDRKDAKDKSVGIIKIPSWDEWNGEASAISDILDGLRCLPCHVIVTAHVMEANMTQGKTTTKIRPIVTGMKRTSSILPGYFDEVYHFQCSPELDGTTHYKFYTKGTGDDFAGTALNLPREIDFTNKNAYEILTSYLTPEALEQQRKAEEARKPTQF